MQIATKSNLIFIDSSLHRLASCLTANNQAEFYQQISKGLIKGISTKQSLEQVGNKFIALAEYADELRQMDVVEHASQLLIHLPLGNKYQSIGNYYQALCVYREGRFVEARSLFERVVEKAPQAYKAKALLSIAATFYQSQDLHPFLSFCLEANRAATTGNYYDAQTIIKAQRNIALYKSLDGDHYGAVSSLERMFPMVRAMSRWQPYLLHQHLNSFAVELGEVGRIEEAQNVCRITLASPYVIAYPEWRETWQDLALRGYKSRSSIRLKTVIHKNVLNFPEREPSDTPVIKRGRARVLSLEKWRRKMGKEEDIDQMDFNELIVKLLQITACEEASEEKLRKIVKSAIEIMKD